MVASVRFGHEVRTSSDSSDKPGFGGRFGQAPRTSKSPGLVRTPCPNPSVVRTGSDTSDAPASAPAATVVNVVDDAGYRYWLRRLAPYAEAGYTRGWVDDWVVELSRDDGETVRLPRPRAGWVAAALLFRDPEALEAVHRYEATAAALALVRAIGDGDGS